MVNLSNAFITHDPRNSQQGEPNQLFQQGQVLTPKIEEVVDGEENC